jgi:hypothetical protein
MLWVVLPHKDHLPERDVVPFMDVEERSGESCLTYRSSRSNISLNVPGTAGACTDMAERQPNHIPEPLHTPHEGGNGAPGLPPTLHERAKPPPESQEHQPLPSVWDIIELEVRLESPESQMTREEYDRGNHELMRLVQELDEKGTPRDKLIVDLYRATTKDPTVHRPSPFDYHYRDISLEEFQQFRSRVEPRSEEEIREEVHKAEEEFERKYQEQGARLPPPDPRGHF